MPEPRRNSASFGAVLLAAVFVVGIFGYLGSMQGTDSLLSSPLSFFFSAQAATSSGATHVLNIGGFGPRASAVLVNGGSPITLTPNATTAVTVSFTLTDMSPSGCSGVLPSGNVTTTLFRNGVSSTCATASPSLSNQSLLNCYVMSTTTYSCSGTSTSMRATTTFGVWYFADATDTSSTYSGQNWGAYVEAKDASGTVGAAATSSGVQLNSLLAITLATNTLNYGTLQPDTNTGSTNQSSTIKNAGNVSTTLQVNGTALVPSIGTTTIPTSSQHYATGTFTYGVSDVQLQEAATAVSGWLTHAASLLAWSSTATYSTGYYSLAGTGWGEYIYVSGGMTPTLTATVRFAKPRSNGSISNWSSTQSLPSTLVGHGMVAMNGFVYIVGGDSSGSPTLTSTVLVAPISATGSIGAWATTTPLPQVRAYSPTTAYNGYIYTTGGMICCYGASNNTYYAKPNASGTITNWSSTTVLPYNIYAADTGEAFAYNDRLYVIGGMTDGGGTLTSNVVSAPINATGSLGAWTSTVPYPFAVVSMAVYIQDDFVYVAGGTPDNTTQTSTVYMGVLNASGSIVGSWSRVRSLPIGRESYARALLNGYMYVIAGDFGGAPANTVYYAPSRSKNIYWGAAVPSGQPGGSYSSTITYTAVYTP